ncbi:XAC2610-related protein [Aequorivita xiaoshiensis]|uniref:VCBS repeat-containing protein n=1 Tax=Aequorivita xiaoshiensis TaxID=2874476 RepID=A0A9X1R508_9FLAO|nr:hypothetical protein [Aequorivita xiaoshiensis]MCG2431857.1 hypothetical protein [Aequorivita xiaoshiensis]
MKSRFNFAFLFILFNLSLYSQEYRGPTWVNLEDGMTNTLKFTNTDILKSSNGLTFKATWKEDLDLSDEEYAYGGISELHVYKGQRHIQTIKNIVDYIALGYVNLTFFDYNMDGYLDFTVPISCGGSCYEKYYLYNPKTKMFTHQKEWDYLRIWKFNKATKQIRSVPDGNAMNAKHYLYKVDGLKLIKVKTIE